MKKNLILLGLSACLLVSCDDNPLTIHDPVMCDEIWQNVSSVPCGIDFEDAFDFTGEVDFCSASSNDSYPFDEQVWFFVAFGSNDRDAREEFERNEAQDRGQPGYTELDNIGEESYAFLNSNSLPGLDHLFLEVLSGRAAISVEVNFSQTGGDCLDEGAVYQFVERIIAALPE